MVFLPSRPSASALESGLNRSLPPHLPPAQRSTRWSAFCLVPLLFCSLPARAQSRGWAWLAGGATSNGHGVYGAKGTAAAANLPGGRSAASSWTDANGNFWLFGGLGSDANGSHGSLNDLWEASVSSAQWTWIAGSNRANQPGVYGSLRNGASGNTPGARSGAAGWTDASGRFWLFGGSGYDSTGKSGLLDDLWMFDPTKMQWTWMGGNNKLTCNGGVCGQAGIYGSLDKPAAGNLPGGRSLASACTDQNGNFWLFGGAGIDSAGAEGSLNDLWEFNTDTLKWAWMAGSSTFGAAGARPGVYGNLHAFAAGNVPGGRFGASCWIDRSGHFWLFGGEATGEFNDLWEFDPSTLQWAWMGGAKVTGQAGVQGYPGVPATQYVPGSREGATAWADSSGNFWLFGGAFQNLAHVTSEGSPIPDFLNDLWQFNPSTLEWAWWGGGDALSCSSSGLPASPDCLYEPGSYATPGSPGGRSAASEWTDGEGNFRIFGGAGSDANGAIGALNDIWLNAAPADEPVFSLQPGTYTGTQSVTITDATSGASIYYTLDGSTPTAGSARYSGPVALTATSVTLQAIAIANDQLPSTIASASYTLILPEAAKPAFSPAPGAFNSLQTVTISDSTPRAAIYYTLASNPSAGFTLYTKPIKVSTPATIEAIAVAPGYSNSAEASARYSIGTTRTTLKVSGADPYKLTCSVAGPRALGKPGPTGAVTFTDTTAHETLGRLSLGAATASATLVLSYAQVGSAPVGLASGDFNHDGRPDLAVVNSGDGTVSILLGNGDGTFQPQAVLPAGIVPENIVAADFNHDGNLDLAITDVDANQVIVLLGNGKGGFTAAPSLPTETNPWGIAVGDFDGDGKLDIAVTNEITRHVSVMLGRGDGTFEPQKISFAGKIPQSFVAGHFFGPGKPLDLMVADQLNAALKLLIGNGDGTFNPQTDNPTGVGEPAIFVATADFNGDGKPDLAVASTGPGDTGEVTVLLGKGDGTFELVGKGVSIPRPFNTADLVAGNFTGSGAQDLALVNQDSGEILLLAGNGNGTFQPPVAIPAAIFPAGIAVADFNHDGTMDFATAGAAGNTVSIATSEFQESASAALSDVKINYSELKSHTLECTYSGDSNYMQSSSNKVTLTATQAAPPVISLEPGIHPGEQTIRIKDASPGALIHYATDGAAPTVRSTLYLGPFTVKSAVTIKALAEGAAYSPSKIAEGSYKLASAPRISRSLESSQRGAADNFEGVIVKADSASAAETVTITDATRDAVIYYTTDGTTPSTNSKRYSGPVMLTESMTVKAFATAPGAIDSPVASAAYSPAGRPTPAN
jgi:N-acetylneuraminic acid mutarotase